MAEFDLFVIGAGSGGVRAARVSAAHGARVAIAEEHKVGGTCVIRGCVPKKLLVYGAHFAEDIDDAAMFGWDVPVKKFDWPVLRDNVLAEVSRLEGAYTDTLENHDVTIFHERAELAGPNEVFHLETMPKRIVIAGGGYIANEFAGIFHQFGAHVTLVNRSDTLLRHYDQQLVDRLLQISVRKGIDYRFNVMFDCIEQRDDGSIRITMEGCDDLEADAVLFAVGRRPNVEGLGCEAAGIEVGEGGEIKVDADNRTSVPSIFAVGDVTNRVQLTPVAIREGQAFADTYFGKKPSRVDYGCIPSAVFSHPPLAGVGMTESDARNKLGSVKTFTSDFRAMKNVLAGRNERSLYKLVVDGETDQIVGVHMIGPDAPEILQAAAIAVKAKLKKADFDSVVALHPTMAEELVLMK
jgi:glutathione reductase (NADPH)